MRGGSPAIPSTWTVARSFEGRKNDEQSSPVCHFGQHSLEAGPGQGVSGAAGRRYRRDAQRGHRPNHHVEAEVLKLFGGEVGRAAELGHVSEQRRVDFAREGPEHFGGGQRLGENRVGAGFAIHLRAADRALESLDAGRIGARDYPLVEGCVLTFAMTYVVVNMAIDLVYAVIDPRVRIS